jgi:hypothetical protein
MTLKPIRRRAPTSVIISLWKRSLQDLLSFYDRKRGPLKTFFPKLFGFFVVLNILCYWLGMMTAHPDLAFGSKWEEYFLMQYPVGILGALFDSLSFFVTIHIARRALNATSALSYIAHLSVDLLIALIATGWVLLVFTTSSWLVSLVVQSPEAFTSRAGVYEQRVSSAIASPTQSQNLRNIYFGVVMGISAMLPSLTHLLMSLNAALKYSYRRLRRT